MTEFHQFKRPQDRRLEPLTNDAQDPVIDAIARNAMSDPQNSSAEINDQTQPEKPPYEVIQQGPITYFRYYFEDADQTTYVTSDAPELVAKKSRLPLYLAGGGVLGATLISGVVIAGLDHPSKPTPKTTPSSEVKQTPKTPTTQPQVVPPEVMPQSRSTRTKPAQKSKKTPTQKSSAARKVSSSELILQQALVVPEAPPVIKLPPVPPAMPPSSLRLPVSTPPQSQPEVAVRPLPEVSAAPLPTVPPAPRPTSAPSFQNPPASASTPPSETAKGPQNASAAQCLSPATEVRNVSLANTAPTFQAVSETVAGPSATPKADIKKSLILKAAQSIAAQATSGAGENKELQEFLELPQRFPSSAGIAVLPLPCQMAQMAIVQQKVGEFSVLRLKPQDYQKRWQASSKNPQALLPIYGFVDYGQQSIVLVQSS